MASWEESALVSCAYAVLSAVRSADIACDVLCEHELKSLALSEMEPHVNAAWRASDRALSQAVALSQKLGAKSRRARMAHKAAQAAQDAARGAQAAMEPEELDAALGRAQRAAVAIFDLLGRARPELPVTEGPAAVLSAPPRVPPTLPSTLPAPPRTVTARPEDDTLPCPALPVESDAR